MRRVAGFIFLACITTACTFGLTTDRFTPARRAEGVRGEIATAKKQLYGEVIAVRDDGLIILADNVLRDQGRVIQATKVLRLVPYSEIRTTRFDQMMPPIDITGGRAPAPKARERLRLVSRYPQGLTPALLSDLLRAYGQTALAGIDQ